MLTPGPMLLRGVDRAAFATAFARRLRTAGLPVPPTAVQAFTAALDAAPVRTTAQLYWVSRTTLVRRHPEIETFDAVFAAVFGAGQDGVAPGRRRQTPSARTGPDGAWTSVPARATAGEQAGGGLPWITRPTPTAGDDEPGTGHPVPDPLPSALEALADTGFPELDEEQLAMVGAWIEAALPRWPVRPGRRRRVHPAGRRAALRATLAAARRTGWEPVRLVCTRPTTRHRRVLVLCDVSRSMQPTTTAYLHLMRAAALRTPTEVFAFGTRLTRLTAVLAHRSAPRAVQLATDAVEDRFGGTRIATTIESLLRSRHGSALRAATVVIASDGWDTDPPERLERAMRRLRRRAHAVLWVNPRAAAPGYAPTAGGMAAALPHCDALLPGHSLRALLAVVDAITLAG